MISINGGAMGGTDNGWKRKMVDVIKGGKSVSDKKVEVIKGGSNKDWN